MNTVPKLNIFVGSNSLSYGFTVIGNYLEYARPLIPYFCQIWNGGRPGQPTTSLTSYALLMDDTFIQPGAFNIYVFFEDTNQIVVGGSTGAQAYGFAKTHCAARKAAGWNKVCLMTPVSRNAAGFESQRQALLYLYDADFGPSNADLISLANAGNTYADIRMDLGRDANLGGANSWSNTTYFNSDGTHWSLVGHQYVAAKFVKLITYVARFSKLVSGPRH